MKRFSNRDQDCRIRKIRRIRKICIRIGYFCRLVISQGYKWQEVCSPLKQSQTRCHLGVYSDLQNPPSGNRRGSCSFARQWTTCREQRGHAQNIAGTRKQCVDSRSPRPPFGGRRRRKTSGDPRIERDKNRQLPTVYPGVDQPRKRSDLTA